MARKLNPERMLWSAAQAHLKPKAPDRFDDDGERVPRRMPASGTDEQIADRLRRGMSQTAIRAELGCGQERVQRVQAALGITLRPGKRKAACTGVREHKTFRTGDNSQLRGSVGLPEDWRTFTAHYDEIADAVILRVKDRFAEPVREPPTFVRVACEACDPSEGAERATQHAYGCPHFSVPRKRKRKVDADA